MVKNLGRDQASLVADNSTKVIHNTGCSSDVGKKVSASLLAIKHICASKPSLVNSWDRVNIPYSKRINSGNHKPLTGFCPFYSLLYNTVTKGKQKLICWDTKNVWGISQHSFNFWSLWSISWAMDHSVHHYFKLSPT